MREGVLLGLLLGDGRGLDGLGLAEEEVVVADAVHTADLVQVLNVPVRVLIGDPLVSMEGVEVLLGLGHAGIAQVEKVGQVLPREVPQRRLLRHCALDDRSLEPVFTAKARVSHIRALEGRLSGVMRGHTHTWRR